MARKNAAPDFEHSLAELQTLVERLESATGGVVTAMHQSTEAARGANAEADQAGEFLGNTVELIAAKDHAESALLVQQGRAEAFGMDDILLYGVRASALNPSALVVVGEPIQVEPYAIMLRRDDPAFKKLVDDTLKELIRNGEFVALYKKWFESPIPPRGINLNAPMSEELRNNMKNLSDQPVL